MSYFLSMSFHIEIDQLTKFYSNSNVPILKNLSLKINIGDFISIVGQSGSGKTTLVNLVGLLDSSFSGKYHLMEGDTTKLNSNDRATLRLNQMAIVFQGYNLISNLTSVENVMLPMIYKGLFVRKARTKAIDLLKEFGLNTYSEYTPGQLSGGQQQRVAIARAIANDPSIILADEPTGNLDDGNTSVVMEVFRQINKNGKTIILITHDKNLAKKASKKFELIKGSLIQYE